MLPQGFTARPAVMADINIAVDFFNQVAVEENLPPETTVENYGYQWESPGFNLETDTRIIFAPDGALAGYGEVWESAPYVHTYVWQRVISVYRRMGIGDYLLQWSEDRMQQSIHKAPADARITMVQSCIDTNQDVHQFLEAHGFKLVRYFNTMRIEMQSPPPDTVLPEDIIIRPYIYETEFETVLRTFREAFRDHWGHVPRSFEDTRKDWLHLIDNDPSYDPGWWFVALDGDEMVGVALGYTPRPDIADDPGWLGTVCVRRPWRTRGIALALLQHSFGEYYRRGVFKVELGVDSQNLTGATRLYEKAGMHVHQRYANYEKEMRPGRELGLQEIGANEA